MSTSRLGAVVLASTVLALTALVACEDSTTGAQIVQPLKADAGSEAGTSAEAGPTREAGTITLSSCVECIATECQVERAECGLQCTNAVTCFADCGDSVDCQDRCLRNVNDFNGHPFFGCVLTCGDPKEPDKCGFAFQHLLLGTSYGVSFCQKYQECNPAGMIFSYGTFNDCVISVGRYFQWQTLLTDGRVSLVDMTACQANVAQTTCEDFNSARLNNHCILRGTRLIDEPCIDDAQCETSFCATDDITCAKCALPPSVGKACMAGRCGPGLVCVDDGKDGLCAVPSHWGDPCDAGHPCEGSSFCKSGFCESKSQTVGAACSTTAPCDSLRGFTCDTSTNKCIAYGVSGPGAACGFNAGGYNFCLRSAACAGGKCEAPPEVDEPCDVDEGPSCLFPSQCIDGKCRDLPVSGTDCR